MGTSESPELVRKFLVHMESLSNTYPTVRPDYNCHNMYMHALAESLRKNNIPGLAATELAEDHVLNTMMGSKDDTAAPDKWSFNMLLSILSRSGLPDLSNRAESVVCKMEEYYEVSGRTEKTQPNTNTYNSLMTCYTKFGNSDNARRALILLQKMKRLAANDNPHAKPDTVTYNIAMNAFAKSRRRDAPTKVEDLLHEMNDEYSRTGDSSIRPNRRTVNTCLEAWAKSGLDGADERIMAWIVKMREAHESGQSRICADIWSYTHYLQALSKTGKPRMGDEAERILKEIEDLYHRGYQSVKPNVLTFTNAIHCIALSGQDDAVERALAILDRMEDLHAAGNGDIRPNLFTYNCVINTVAKSRRKGKAELALQLLSRIQSVALRPGTVSFNNVINACAFSNHPKDDPSSILRIALQVLKEAQDGPGANWITYQSTIRVICTFEVDSGTHFNRWIVMRFAVHDCERTRVLILVYCCLLKMAETRCHLTREILRQCCNDGQLTETVLTQVRFAVNETQFSAIKSEVTDALTGTLLDTYTLCATKTFLDSKRWELCSSPRFPLVSS